jgi:hypothetical protein
MFFSYCTVSLISFAYYLLLQSILFQFKMKSEIRAKRSLFSIKQNEILIRLIVLSSYDIDFNDFKRMIEQDVNHLVKSDNTDFY